VRKETQKRFAKALNMDAETFKLDDMNFTIGHWQTKDDNDKNAESGSESESLSTTVIANEENSDTDAIDEDETDSGKDTEDDNDKNAESGSESESLSTTVIANEKNSDTDAIDEDETDFGKDTEDERKTSYVLFYYQNATKKTGIIYSISSETELYYGEVVDNQYYGKGRYSDADHEVVGEFWKSDFKEGLGLGIKNGCLSIIEGYIDIDWAQDGDENWTFDTEKEYFIIEDLDLGKDKISIRYQTLCSTCDQKTEVVVDKTQFFSWLFNDGADTFLSYIKWLKIWPTISSTELLKELILLLYQKHWRSTYCTFEGEFDKNTGSGYGILTDKRIKLTWDGGPLTDKQIKLTGRFENYLLTGPGIRNWFFNDNWENNTTTVATFLYNIPQLDKPELKYKWKPHPSNLNYKWLYSNAGTSYRVAESRKYQEKTSTEIIEMLNNGDLKIFEECVGNKEALDKLITEFAADNNILPLDVDNLE
jgi:hypothetical protein